MTYELFILRALARLARRRTTWSIGADLEQMLVRGRDALPSVNPAGSAAALRNALRVLERGGLVQRKPTSGELRLTLAGLAAAMATTAKRRGRRAGRSAAQVEPVKRRAA